MAPCTGETALSSNHIGHLESQNLLNQSRAPKKKKTQAQFQQYLSLTQLQVQQRQEPDQPVLQNCLHDLKTLSWTNELTCLELLGLELNINFVRNSCSLNRYISLEHLLLLLFITETFVLWRTFSLNSVLTAILFATKEGNVVFSYYCC